MSLTRLIFVTVLVKRLGPAASKAGMYTTAVATNEDMQDPMSFALIEAGYTVADPTSVTEAEVGAVSSDDWNKVFHLGEYRLLQNIVQNLDDVDTQLGPRREQLSQLGERLQRRLDRLEDKLSKVYGIGTPELQSGLLSYDFAQHNETPASE